jgi:hypothetical protein
MYCYFALQLDEKEKKIEIKVTHLTLQTRYDTGYVLAQIR